MAALVSVSATLGAQKMSEPVREAMDACIAMREAIGSGSTPGISAALEMMKNCDAEPFPLLKGINIESFDVTGHFVFTPQFAKALLDGRDVYAYSRRYARIGNNPRGSGRKGVVYMATFGAAAGTSAKYSLRADDQQDIAVVTEPLGMITLRVYDSTHDKWYNDDSDAVNGKPYRHVSFNLKEPSNLVIEVINTSGRDISFVIIGN